MRLLDAAGRPVVAYVERSTRVAERWLGRRVRFHKGVVYHRSGRLGSRALILFAGSTKWYEARHVFAPPRAGETPNIPILRALRTYCHDHWWVSASGALERRATLYEERVPDPPPRVGWRLATVDDVGRIVADRKRELHAPESETDRDLAHLEQVRRSARRLARALETLASHERRLARQSRLVDKWRKRIAEMQAR
jgi:hypothetical protein